MQTANDVRSTFIDYFARNGHEHVSSSPLVPRNDPTLLFTNAGMVQFKNAFTGAETRPYNRAVTSQKCVRAGGKHNDLENVGYTARHHTFFEMLGNFSFGDYFKDQAIELAWTLITKEYGLPADRLLVTVYAEDEEAAGLWRKIAGLGDDRIIRIPTSDNFWQMGDTGPCGPCSEIFFDHGPGVPGGPPGSPEEDGDRFIEIWNLVFMQYDQIAPGNRKSLPRPSIDTGMGLERITAVLQGKHDNYDIDLMRQIIEASAEVTGAAVDGPLAVSHRVIADHLRSASFLIADGVMPSNEGRGYVLRRILRRAMRHIHKTGVQEPVMWKLVPTLTSLMGQAFPELVRAGALITETLKLEETRFQATLDRGLRLLEDETGRLADGGALPGDVAFKLYDTFGFPLDLTQDVLRAEGRAVDVAGFDAAMERQRAEARKSWVGSGEAASADIWYAIRDRVGPTEFLGYETGSAEGVVGALVADGAETKSVGVGDEAWMVVNQTPFYAESGGQVGDAGIVFSAAGAEAAVVDTQKQIGNLWVHRVKVVRGELGVGQAVELRVDEHRRLAIQANHSATHLLHEALRRHLGDHVTQKGSLVSPDRLRFDISQPSPVARGALNAVELEVNARIRENSEVVTRLMSPDEAIDHGAMALFGEKYGDVVRVVSMGRPETGRGNRAYSLELCGGIHVTRTGDIGAFKILSDSGVAAGIRRIEALTGAAAIQHAELIDDQVQKAASVVRSTPADLPDRIATLVEDRRRLEREVADLRRRLAAGGTAEGGDAAPEKIGDVSFIGRVVEDLPAKDLKPMADDFKKRVGSGVVVLVAVGEGKASVVVAVTDDLSGRHDAVALVRLAAAALGGKGGGGRPDMAQAGGPDGGAAEAAVSAVRAALLP